jgi:hypothetical protein
MMDERPSLQSSSQPSGNELFHADQSPQFTQSRKEGEKALANEPMNDKRVEVI